MEGSLLYCFYAVYYFILFYFMRLRIHVVLQYVFIVREISLVALFNYIKKTHTHNPDNIVDCDPAWGEKKSWYDIFARSPTPTV